MNTGRVVILGAGIAALTAALRLAPRPVLVISPDRLGQGASSAWAQGGIAAALGPDDSVAAHVADTVAAGAGIVDATVARIVSKAAADQVQRLAVLGVPFDRDETGAFALSREAAHGQSRVARVQGDRSGAAIMAALVSAVRATASVQVIEGLVAERLEVVNGRVAGVWLGLADRPSQAVLLMAPAVLLATGGAAGLFAVTTNPQRVRGQGLGMAARAGAAVADAEFVQFHPTAIACGTDPVPLATEALRGDGAHLVNRLGERFMVGLHPDAELAPRDIVARAVFAQSAAGLSPALDARAIFEGIGASRFPTVAAACAGAGIDPARRTIPMTAAAHYHMGGVACDGSGRSSLPGLWVAGEVACTGLHGANRLASNGLLEALVMAERAATDIAASLPCEEAGLVRLAPAPGRPVGDPPVVGQLRGLMTAHCGLIRDAAGLRATLDSLRDMVRAPQTEPVKNMLATATLIAAAALLRRESRGGHFRADHPLPAPALARRSRLVLAEAVALRDERMPA